MDEQLEQSPEVDLETNTQQSRWGKEPPKGVERDLLAGPSFRRSEFMRVVRIAAEFIRGFRALHFVGPCVTVFGSARFNSGSPHYELARLMGKRIAEMDLAV
ncbi:MAG: hypothetical protein ACIAQ0_13990, partial [Phycisphaerales bacterium JB058]